MTWRLWIPFLGVVGALAFVSVGCGEDGDAGSCVDGVRNADESDVDCGGRCAACRDGFLCADDGDCRSGVCDAAGGRCAFPSCDDGLRNADETDVDCGGPACSPCPEGAACERGADCQSVACGDGICLATSCADGRRNGEETDVDCGGSVCPACEPGDACRVRTDCDSLRCLGGRCGTSSCSDGLANGAETDVDCGGPDCLGCSVGDRCEVGGDCYEGLCLEGLCVDAGCTDGVRNGQESDVDCGRACVPCADGLACRSEPDCQSGVCDRATDTCAAPSCDDFVRNGDETDLDCGGSCPLPCEAGQGCAVDADCFDRSCGPAGTCLPPTCDDGARNGDETDTDCGGSVCGPCGDGLGCARPRDCTSLVCDTGLLTCAAPTCDDGVANGDESDVDCGGPACGGCATFLGCAVDSDCESATCRLRTCVPSDCLDPFGTSPGYVGCASTPTATPCPDVSVTGTAVTLFDDDIRTVTMPFSFRVGTGSYTSISIGSNGYLELSTPEFAAFPECLPSSFGPEVLIAPYWADLDPTRGGTVRYQTLGTSPERTFVVQWKTFPYDFLGTTGQIDVRVVLHEGSNRIDVCYVDTTVGDSFLDQGGNATAGVQDGTSSLEFSCGEAVLEEGLVLTYWRR